MSSQGHKRFKEKMVNGFRFERRNSNSPETFLLSSAKFPSSLLTHICFKFFALLIHHICLLQSLCSTELSIACSSLPSHTHTNSVSLPSSPTKNSCYFLTHFKLSSFNVETKEKNPHKAQVGVQCKAHPRQAWVHKTHTFTGKQRLRTNSFHH